MTYRNTTASCLTPELGRDDQLIANAGNRLDLDRAFFDLLAQVRHVDVDSAGLTVEVEAPGFL